MRQPLFAQPSVCGLRAPHGAPLRATNHYLLNKFNEIRFPRGCGRFRAVAVADDAVADADEVFRQAPFFEEGFPFGRFKFFFGPVDPARAEVQGSGGIHEIAQDEAAVGPSVRGFFHVGQDQEDRRGAVHGVTRRAHNFGVESAQAGQGIRILDDDDGTGLQAMTAGCIGAGLENQIQVFIADLGLFVLADAAPRDKGMDGFIHDIHS